MRGKAIESAEKHIFEPEEEECIAELKLDKNQIKAINNKDIVSEGNSRFNEFLGCYFHKMGWQNENGEIYYDKINKSVNDELKKNIKNGDPSLIESILQMLSEIIEHCNNKSSTMNTVTHGEIAVKVQNCVFRKVLAIAGQLAQSHIIS